MRLSFIIDTKDLNMIEREARVLEILINENYFRK